MSANQSNVTPLRPQDFIKQQQRFVEEKSRQKQDPQKKKEPVVLEADVSADQDDDQVQIPDQNFLQDLMKALTESRDRQFVDNKLQELDFYQKLATKMMSQGCDANSYKTAKSFLLAIEQAKALLERLWKFYGTN